MTELLLAAAALGWPRGSEQLSPGLCIGLRLSWGFQGLQEAALEPGGGNRQVTVRRRVRKVSAQV